MWKNWQFLIANHYDATGAAEELRDFLVKNRVKKVVYIAHPFANTKRRKSFVEVYEKGELTAKIESIKVPGVSPNPLATARDIIYTVKWTKKFASESDIAVGGNPLMAYTLCKIKKLCRLKKVVFYTIDFSPIRFKEKLKEKIYRIIDKKACLCADEIWSLTKRTLEGRTELGWFKLEDVKWREVPYGNHSSMIKPASRKEVKFNKIVYLGGLDRRKGGHILPEILVNILKEAPEVKLHIVGGSQKSEDTKIVIENLQKFGISDKVVFTGYFEDHREMQEYIKDSAVALAPYTFTKDNYTFYADPGKVKLYLGAGLPIVITKVPQIAETVSEKRAGISVETDSPQDIADAVVKLLKDKSANFEMRENARKLGELYDFDRIFFNLMKSLEEEYARELST